ncbi:MAG: hypothetical protein VX778_00845, partial [Candidatus Thermoplasmatota archaeon]|nr:hypothetical protein [Candidatus Thermoplasmatota archaeon]
MVDATDVALEAFILFGPENKLRTVLVGAMLVLAGSWLYWVVTVDEGDETQSRTGEANSDTDWRHYSVVAPVDTGINVYHDHFRTDEVYPNWLLESLGVTKTCYITFDGSWEERYQADKEYCWDNITTSDIVYFYGTKIIGTSPDGQTDIHILDDPSDGHGTAVTGAVLDANPD